MSKGLRSWYRKSIALINYMPNLGRTNTCDLFFLVVANQYIYGVFANLKSLYIKKLVNSSNCLVHYGVEYNMKHLHLKHSYITSIGDD